MHYKWKQTRLSKHINPSKVQQQRQFEKIQKRYTSAAWYKRATIIKSGKSVLFWRNQFIPIKWNVNPVTENYWLLLKWICCWIHASFSSFDRHFEAKSLKLRRILTSTVVSGWTGHAPWQTVLTVRTISAHLCTHTAAVALGWRTIGTAGLKRVNQCWCIRLTVRPTVA